ncbi:MAG TPA: alkaline phosphatase family protein [Chloroflexota bacterium]|nr:alkaline phosphatase family protein [Chloroflexota bacterium]
MDGIEPMHRVRQWLIMLVAVGSLLLAGAQASARSLPTRGRSATGYVQSVHTVFLIVLENRDWASIVGNDDAPFINNWILPRAALAENYATIVHPSELNYLWLEAATDFHLPHILASDADPYRAGDPRRLQDPARDALQRSTNHLVSLLARAHISWKSYQEGIDGKTCPLQSAGRYAAKHNPMVFFDDVTDGGRLHSATCVAHIRPYAELARDLTSARTTARYNFITPDLCDDMHGDFQLMPFAVCAPSVALGDRWLATAVPLILRSPAYRQGGVLFITWDEGNSPVNFLDRDDQASDGPIGLLVLSPYARAGYRNTISYTHSSTLRTIQEILGVTPLLGGAQHARDLRDLFTAFP